MLSSRTKLLERDRSSRRNQAAPAVPRRCLFSALIFAIALMFSAGCNCAGSGDSPGHAEGSDDRPIVVTTTTMLSDMVEVLAGDDVQVAGLMRTGADPHTYQPVPSDARRIASSQLVVTNGLMLEGWIDRLVANAGGSRPVIVAGEGIEALPDPEDPALIDPHIWFDVALWRSAVSTVADGLALVLEHDPGAHARLRASQNQYEEILESLDAWVRATIATIPESRRVLVTSHDAFGYFARAYGMEVVSVQGISTDQEAGQRDVIRVIERVREASIPGVFVETSVHPGLIEQVARQTGAEVAGPLYSDSLGEPGSAAGTYVGMVVENVRMITEALGGEFTPFDGGQTGE